MVGGEGMKVCKRKNTRWIWRMQVTKKEKSKKGQ